jgi:methionine-rich copper-binding protein CopC
MLRRLRLLSALVVAVVLTAAAAPFHFSVVKASPAKDQKLEASPKRLQIWFSQVPAAAVSEIKLKRDTTDVPLGKTVIVAAEKSMYADPVKPIENGAYTLTWRAAGDDGHVMTGEIKFVVELKVLR